MLLIIGLLGIYIYYNYVVSEVPKVYYRDAMNDVYYKMSNLHKKIYWTPWGFHPYIQFLIYLIHNYFDKKIADDIYKLEIIQANDGEDLVMAWGPSTIHSKAIILSIHTLLGDYSDSAKFLYKLHKKYNWIPISYSRRGHSKPLKYPIFNTVGDIDDLILILRKIKARYPLLPIYAIGSSAGSSLLVRYLGEHSDNSLIDAASVISAGYDFERSLFYPKSIPDYIITNKIKNFFLYSNKEVLCNYNKVVYNKLKNVKNIREWHHYQWQFSKKSSNKKEYFLYNNPSNVIKKVTQPILYINAMDDFMFPRDLVYRYIDLIYSNPNKIIVHTERGSHLGFYKGWIPSSWAHDLIEEFILGIYQRKIDL